jgi:ligand-binding sensor domain-containing protein
MSAFSVLLAWCACAAALNESPDINQYAHTSWTVRDGFSLGNVYARAQKTPDGYLWFDTESGMVRFEGVRMASGQPPAGQQLPYKGVYCLLITLDGTLCAHFQID